MSQGAYTFQIFLEKEQMGAMPTVQQLLDMSCLSGDLKFEEVRACYSFNKRSPIVLFFLFFFNQVLVCPLKPCLICLQMPPCLIVQMPRFGNKYKMFPYIIPSTELDITDLLHNCKTALIQTPQEVN